MTYTQASTILSCLLSYGASHKHRQESISVCKPYWLFCVYATQRRVYSIVIIPGELRIKHCCKLGMGRRLSSDWCCCGCGIGTAAPPIRPPAWECRYAIDVAIQKERKRERNQCNSATSVLVLSIYLCRDKNKMFSQVFIQNYTVRSQDTLAKWYEP